MSPENCTLVTNVEKIASLDRGWLPMIKPFSAQFILMVEKIASLDRGWLPTPWKLWT